MLRDRHGHQLHACLSKALHHHHHQAQHPSTPSKPGPLPPALAAPQRLSPSHPHSPSIFRSVVWTPSDAAACDDGAEERGGRSESSQRPEAGVAAGVHGGSEDGEFAHGGAAGGAEGREGGEGGEGERDQGSGCGVVEVQQKNREIDALKREVDSLRSAIRVRTASGGVGVDPAPGSRLNLSMENREDGS